MGERWTSIQYESTESPASVEKQAYKIDITYFYAEEDNELETLNNQQTWLYVTNQKLQKKSRSLWMFHYSPKGREIKLQDGWINPQIC